MRSLVINQCKKHGTWSISLDDEGGGIRLTKGKCCGRWETVKAWDMTAEDLRAMAIEFECQADQLESESSPD